MRDMAEKGKEEQQEVEKKENKKTEEQALKDTILMQKQN